MKFVSSFIGTVAFTFTFSRFNPKFFNPSFNELFVASMYPGSAFISDILPEIPSLYLPNTIFASIPKLPPKLFKISLFCPSIFASNLNVLSRPNPLLFQLISIFSIGEGVLSLNTN